MATTDLVVDRGAHYETHKLTFTANGTITITAPDRALRGISVSSEGTDGGGTMTWNVSSDNATFSTVGLNTSSDPANLTTITSATAAGNWSFHEHNMAFRYYQFVLSGSTSPTLVMYVNFMFA